MMGKNVRQPSNRHVQRRRRAKTQEDHARVGPMLDEDPLSKITVMGNERAFFPVGDSEDIGIGQARRIIADDSGNIVALLL